MSSSQTVQSQPSNSQPLGSPTGAAPGSAPFPWGDGEMERVVIERSEREATRHGHHPVLPAVCRIGVAKGQQVGHADARGEISEPMS